MRENKYNHASRWYNGYRFGNITIYNPWSILNFIDNQGEEKPFWINTADTSMIDRLATSADREILKEIGQLLEGKSIERPVYETIVMHDPDIRNNLLWSFLLLELSCHFIEQL